MFVRVSQYSNAPLLILETEFGMVMFVRVIQKLNAPSPMLVTESGIVILFKVQCSNAVHRFLSRSPV